MKFFTAFHSILCATNPLSTLLIVLTAMACLVECVGGDEAAFIPKDYVKEFPPPLPNEYGDKHSVNVSIEFINLLQILETEGSIQYSWFYRVWWYDARLAPFESSGNPTRVSEETGKQLWRPDVIAENIRTAIRNGIVRPTIYIGRFPGRLLLVSTYLIMRIGCPFDYHNYPLDIQVCRLRVTNMGMTTDELNLQWLKPAFTLNRKHFLKFQDLFSIRICDDTSEPVRITSLGLLPQKTLLLIFERHYHSYNIQCFLPSIMLVFIAWLSILVPPTMLRTRLLLNSTNLLTIISMLLAVSKTEASRVPKISYLTALNLWMFVCVTFVFSSVLLVVFDIRLISVITKPGATIRAAKQFLRKLHKHAVLRQRRDAVPKSNMSLTQFGPLIAVTSSEHAADPDPATPAAAASAAPAVADDDGDLFLDASSVTPVRSHELACTEETMETMVRKRRQLWLEQAAYYERCYLIAFPVLFVLFVTCFFCYYAWKRRSALNALLKNTNSTGSAFPGCWCAENDTWDGCMAEDAYPKTPT